MKGMSLDKASRFLVLVAMSLCIPAVVYVIAGVYSGRAGLAYLLPNYLFMATPHLLVASTILWPRARDAIAIVTLLLLNLWLVAFQIWILLAVPPSESGLAWVLYMPPWVAVLIAYCLTLVVKAIRGPGKAANNDDNITRGPDDGPLP